MFTVQMRAMITGLVASAVWMSVGGEQGSKWAFYLSPVPQPPGAEERPPKLKYSGVYSPD